MDYSAGSFSLTHQRAAAYSYVSSLLFESARVVGNQQTHAVFAGGGVSASEASPNFLPTLERIVERVADDSLLESYIFLVDSAAILRRISENPDGSTHRGGFQLLTQFRNTVAFRANQPGFLGSTQVNDVFFWLRDEAHRGVARMPMQSADEVRLLGVQRNPTRVVFVTAAALAASDADREADLYAFNLETRVTTQLLANLTAVNGYALVPDGSMVSQSIDALTWHKNDGSQQVMAASEPGPMQIDPGFNLHVFDQKRTSINLLTQLRTVRFGGHKADEDLLKGGGVAVNSDGSVLVAISSYRPIVSGTIISPLGRTELPSALNVIGQPIISSDGVWIYFVSPKALVPEDLDVISDVYRWHRLENRFQLISHLAQEIAPVVSSLISYREQEGFLAYAFEKSSVTYLAKFDLNTQITSVTAVPSGPGCLPLASTGSVYVGRICRQTDPSLVVTSYRIDVRTGAVLQLQEPPDNYGRIHGFFDNGQNVLYRDRRGSTLRVRNLLSGQMDVLSAFDKSVRLSPDGRFVLTSSSISLGGGGEFSSTGNGTLELIDLASLNRQLIPESGEGSFEFSQNSCAIVTTGSITHGLKVHPNPFCKTPSNITLLRTVSAQPRFGAPMRVDVLVDHKSTGPAPTGIVRVSAGQDQCDVNLGPQGSFGLGQCSLLLASKNDLGPNADFDSKIKLQYLGDENYGWNEKYIPFTVFQKAVSLQLQGRSIALDEYEVSVITTGTHPNLPLRGTVSISSNLTSGCRLTASDIERGVPCRFNTSDNSELSISAYLLNDPNYNGGALLSLPANSQEILRSGFEDGP